MHNRLQKRIIICVVALALFLCPFSSVTFANESAPPEITKLTLGNWGTYPAADIWMTCGADFENAEEGDEFQLFLVDDESKTELDAIFSGEKCTVKDVPGSRSMIAILGDKQEFGFCIHDMEPGDYYVGAKLSQENGRAAYKYTPFKVYENAKAYTKAALDKVIDSYIREPDGWYWEEGKYVGLGYRTDIYGNSWESWMFPALGTEYVMNDGRTLDFSKNGPILSSYDGRWFLDLAMSFHLKDFSQKKLWKVGMAELAKHILAFSAYNEDPRNIEGLNLITAGVQTLYETDGSFPDDNSPISGTVYGYMITALEISNASPAEGYTRLMRDYLYKRMWEPLEDIARDSQIGAPDNYCMPVLPVHFFKKYPEYSEKVDKIIDNLNAVIDYDMSQNGAMVYSADAGNNDIYNGPNANSLAVVINALVMNGLRVEDFDEGKFTKKYGSLLTSLGSCIVEDGVVYGSEANRMATYQTLGALVDLYCNKSCFEIAHEKYKEAHPEYFAEDYGKLGIKSVSEIGDVLYSGKPYEPEIEVIGELPEVAPRQPVYGTVLPTERKLEEGLDYTIEYKNNIEPGKATIIVTGIGDYRGTKEVTFNIVKNKEEAVSKITKKTQPMTVKTSIKKVSFKKLKKKQIILNALTVKKNQGKVTYKKISGSNKLIINKKTGKITVKKKTKKGLYKMKVKVTAAGNKTYKAGSKTVTVKIRVK